MHIIIHLAKSGFLTVIKTITAIIDEFYNRKETRKNTTFNVVRQYIYVCGGIWVSMRVSLLILQALKLTIT